MVCKETAFFGGKYADRFDEEFAAYCQVPYAAGDNNGTSALGIGHGDALVFIPEKIYMLFHYSNEKARMCGMLLS